ncbi:MAG: 5-formyltetrahydrofolate cyclo-ligase [Phycisphaerae bacterium]|nr:5-formyltetrahydrofolate cyclo-ligase [Phycisphaerae bacterium]
MDKVTIRNNMKDLLGKIDASDRHARSLAACNRLVNTVEFRDSQLIMLFLSMESEVETSTLAIQAWTAGKRIAVPRVFWEQRAIEPVEIQSLDFPPQGKPTGPRDPVQGTLVSLGQIDLVVVPGIAFDRRGYRLGRGKGFYDRFLSQKELRAVRMALCFQEQVLPQDLPVEPHDIPMNMIVTDETVIRC